MKCATRNVIVSDKVILKKEKRLKHSVYTVLSLWERINLQLFHRWLSKLKRAMRYVKLWCVLTGHLLLCLSLIRHFQGYESSIYSYSPKTFPMQMSLSCSSASHRNKQLQTASSADEKKFRHKSITLHAVTPMNFYFTNWHYWTCELPLYISAQIWWGSSYWLYVQRESLDKRSDLI